MMGNSWSMTSVMLCPMNTGFDKLRNVFFFRVNLGNHKHRIIVQIQMQMHSSACSRHTSLFERPSLLCRSNVACSCHYCGDRAGPRTWNLNVMTWSTNIHPFAPPFFLHQYDVSLSIRKLRGISRMFFFNIFRVAVSPEISRVETSSVTCSVWR